MSNLGDKQLEVDVLGRLRLTLFEALETHDVLVHLNDGFPSVQVLEIF